MNDSHAGNQPSAPEDANPDAAVRATDIRLFSGYRGMAFAVLLAYGPAVNVSTAAFIPLDWFRGIFYSTHGGYAWFIVLGSFMWVCMIGAFFAKYNSWKSFVGILIGYIPVSIFCAKLMVLALNPPLNLTVTNTILHFWFPAGLLVEIAPR